MRNNKFYKPQDDNHVRIFPSDPAGSLDGSFYALSPRYLRKDMPGFIFTNSWRLA